MKIRDLTGEKFGRLTVVKRVKNSKSGNIMWECKCECGNTKIVAGGHLKNGSIKSCGCLNVELVKERSTKHGMASTRIYRIWQGMKRRCYNKNQPHYKTYGARGITVCEEWRNSFDSFYTWSMENGYSSDLSIDRKDNNGNYEPSNCRWADEKTQADNKRSTKHVTYKGKQVNISELSRITGIQRKTLSRRIAANPDKSIEELVYKPTSHAERMKIDEDYRNKCIEKNKNGRPNAIKVNMLDIETLEIIMTFDFLSDAAEWISKNTIYKKAAYTNISKVCKGKSKTAYGYKWAYADKGGGC